MEPSPKMTDYKAQGKANRAKGARFELKVRERLEKDGFVVDKWTNNVDLEKGKICPAKRSFNPFTKKIQGIGMGFPDFVGFMKLDSMNCRRYNRWSVILVECKVNGKLSKIEKQKINFLLEEGFKCWIAYNHKERGLLFENLKTFEFKKTKNET